MVDTSGDRSQHSLISDASDGGNRHLALVFFDILFLDSVDVMSTPYSSRRRVLESVVLHIPGYAMLAERWPVEIRGSLDSGQSQLRSIFVQALSDHQEGLVLKAAEGRYLKSPWVKVRLPASGIWKNDC
jgi:DNA ligase 4